MKAFIKFVGELIKRFTSRKFLLTLAGALTLAANQQWTELVVLLTGYTGIEGLADFKSRGETSTVTQVSLQPGDLDEVTGFQRTERSFAHQSVDGIVSGDSLQ